MDRGDTTCDRVIRATIELYAAFTGISSSRFKLKMDR